MGSKQVHEYKLVNAAEAGTPGAIEHMLNHLGKEGWEAWPIPHPSFPDHIMLHRDFYISDQPDRLDEKVDALLAFVKNELFYNAEVVDEDKLRQVVRLVYLES